VGIESTIPVFEREKTVHAIDRADTVIGCFCMHNKLIRPMKQNERLFEEKKNSVESIPLKYTFLNIFSQTFKILLRVEGYA
jgi:hypothetical protein